MSKVQEWLVQPSARILVTGANGFIGVRVIDALLRRGFRNVRCLVRPSSRVESLKGVIGGHSADCSVEILTGDVLSRDDCRTAAEGAAVVLHLAAGVDKSFAGSFMTSVLGTRNLIEAFLDVGDPRRFVSVSSFAVYSNVRLKRRAILDETAPLEDAPQQRFDAYGFGKLKQEELVREYGTERGLPYVILRPGTVYGPGKKDLTGRIGINTFGFFVHVGGRNELPMTFVDNCADAIVLAGVVAGVDGDVFNVVDDEVLTSARFLRAYKRRVGWFFSLRLPYLAAYGLSRMWERYSERSGGQLPPVFNTRRCAADWKGNRFPNAKIKERLGWTPHVSLDAGMERFLAQFPKASA